MRINFVVVLEDTKEKQSLKRERRRRSRRGRKCMFAREINECLQVGYV